VTAGVERWSPEWHRRLRRIIASLPDRTPEEARAIRVELGRHDVIAYAILYLSKHLAGRETGDKVTFAECHYEWARLAESWAEPITEPMHARDAFVAPRSTGKSTWWFLIIPLWAASYGHARFCASFAQAAGQAEGHLQTMRSELDVNPLLKFDFPALTAPARRQSSGSTVADRQSMIHTASGFTFAARGLDSAVLGLKVGEQRPDVLIIDDAEPDEASYSPYLAKKRLGTVTDAIFALNIYARVVMTGTVTMPGSIMHQLVRYAADDISESNEWVRDERIRVHHHRAILSNDDGSERSIWPEKWPLPWLQSRRHTREFAKNYDNDPRAVSGDYWQADDIRYGTLGDLATRWILRIDPAITTKGTSDWTGMTVVACRPAAKPVRGPDGRVLPVQPRPEGLPEWMNPLDSQVEVVAAWGVKLAGEKLRTEVVRTLARWQKIKAVVIETNAAGETWRTILHDLPGGVKLLEVHTSIGKEARFGASLTRWHEGRVVHRERFPVLEDQLISFPRTQWDDVADSTVGGVEFFLVQPARVQVGSKTSSYA
jgi:hypothetical protein